MSEPDPSTDVNLLVVDWDFFFPNPHDGGDSADLESYMLYDWKHFESRFMIDAVWYTRAAAFVERGHPFPYCTGYESFWERFTIAENAPLYVADSNRYAGIIRPETDAQAWSSVWLFDAHHDSGYRGTWEEWRATGMVTCEDWMLAHAERGSQLHVRYPTWRSLAFEGEPEPLTVVDRQFDDGAEVPVAFDAVFVCRSGAWVPPWCDSQLVEFLDDCPTSWMVNVDENYPDLCREFSLAMVSTMADEVRMLREFCAAANRDDR